jgi:hypothetical protein
MTSILLLKVIGLKTLDTGSVSCPNGPSFSLFIFSDSKTQLIP